MACGADELHEDYGVVECGSECLVLVAAVGYGYVVGVEAWAVVDSSVEVVAC